VDFARESPTDFDCDGVCPTELPLANQDEHILADRLMKRRSPLQVLSTYQVRDDAQGARA